MGRFGAFVEDQSENLYNINLNEEIRLLNGFFGKLTPLYVSPYKYPSPISCKTARLNTVLFVLLFYGTKKQSRSALTNRSRNLNQKFVVPFLICPKKPSSENKK